MRDPQGELGSHLCGVQRGGLLAHRPLPSGVAVLQLAT